MFDPRLDTRTYEEMQKSMERFEKVEEATMSKFCSRYEATFGGSVGFENYGFRANGLERDIKKINAKPDFKMYCTDGPFTEITVEVQGMQYDKKQFHVKHFKFKKAQQTNSIFIQLSGLDGPNERFAVMCPKSLRKFELMALTEFGVLGYPGTFCPEFPEGKPSIRFLDSWFKWNYTNNNEALKMN